MKEFREVEEEDLKYIIEGHIGEKEQFSREECLIMAETIRQQISKIQPK